MISGQKKPLEIAQLRVRKAIAKDALFYLLTEVNNNSTKKVYIHVWNESIFKTKIAHVTAAKRTVFSSSKIKINF